jgi:gas vesicle protein
MRAFSFMRGIVIGGLIGAGIALLMTPASGEELREQMQEQANRLQIEVKTAAETKRHELEQQLELLRAPKNG